MATTANGPFASVTGPERRRARGGGRDWWAPVLIAIALVALLLAIVPGLATRRDGVRSLPEAQRAALVERTLGELRQFCGESRPYALAAHCRELASFAAQFNECTDECKALVRLHLAPRPTR